MTRILDGGLATALERRGFELHPELWSAGVFLRAPEAVEALHHEYLRAGAEVLTSASYQMSFAGLERAGLDRSAAADAMRRTVQVALHARDVRRSRALVAASVGPYGAILCDGSEYRGDYEIDIGALADFHRERFAVLAASGADLLAIETVPSFDEARVLLGLLTSHPGVAGWISFSCRDGHRISDGTPISECARLLDDSTQVVAVGVNCTPPHHVSSLIGEIRRASGKPIVVYPNSGERWDATRRAWSGGGETERFCALARRWAEQGVWGIGGCCRVGPEAIAELARSLRQGC